MFNLNHLSMKFVQTFTFQKNYLTTIFCLFSLVVLFNVEVFGQASDFAQYDTEGPYQTVSNQFDGPNRDYAIFRPASLGADGEQHPIITWGNGTGATPEIYAALCDHLASYGFVVIASRSRNTGSGREMIGGIDWLLSENNRRGSIYYQKINASRIGATGHSQGGAGTINTASRDGRVTAIAPLAPATFTAPFFYSTRNVECPMFIMAGARDNLANPSSVFRVSFRSATTTAIYGSLTGADHFTFTDDAGPFKKYITAWFDATLWKDSDAEELFFASEASLFQDRSWDRLEATDLDEYTPGTEGPDGGNEFFLSDNVPNPFSDQTRIAYGISEAGNVRLTIYNAFGFPITSLVNDFQEAGRYEVTLEAGQLPRRGTYYYVLRANGEREIKRLILE